MSNLNNLTVALVDTDRLQLAPDAAKLEELELRVCTIPLPEVPRCLPVSRSSCLALLTGKVNLGLR